VRCSSKIQKDQDTNPKTAHNVYALWKTILHRAVPTIFRLIYKTVIIAQMLSAGGTGFIVRVIAGNCDTAKIPSKTPHSFGCRVMQKTIVAWNSASDREAYRKMVGAYYSLPVPHSF